MRLILLALLLAFASSQSQQVVGLPNSQLITDTSYAGLINVDPSKPDAALFYWFFESRGDKNVDPLVLWMTGGPGCSSELALLYENGPFTVDPQLILHPNDWSWTNISNLIFIDQPFGTGFSPKPHGDIVNTEEKMAEYVYAFLQGFLKLYPAYATRDFYITGESYAGHYIPALAKYIVDANAKKTNPIINLRAIAIGNGWVVPEIQYNYEPFAVANNLTVKGSREDQRLVSMYQECKTLLDLGLFIEATDVCNLIMESVVHNAPKIGGYPINHYNIKEPCTVPSLCYDFSNQTAYMNLPATQKALGVNRTDWESCSTAAGLPLTKDRIKAYDVDLPPVMDAGVRVLVYSGMYDLICEYMQGLEWLSAMNWTSQAAFNNAQLKSWNPSSSLAGSYKSTGLLAWLQVEQAGHMVPHDQPQNAFYMFQNFLKGVTFWN